MRQIAIYGKGGIGKSTISANLSASLAEMGYQVLQVGCDPKHDSTRMLLGGELKTTMLEAMRLHGRERLRQEMVVHEGYLGIRCVEAGGPEPGVGCAGQGIITTFKLLEELKVYESGIQVVLYDVLGDVVC
ncbi:MAG: AAA family ATPase, partial [Candidatus Tectomicrobia bacterium]|nr:AAA family ATPase [Candidatus Tectomicrobia bacterium]